MTAIQRNLAPAGNVSLRVVRRAEPQWPHADQPGVIRAFGFPNRDASPVVNAWRQSNLRNLARGLRTVVPARKLRIPTFYGALFGRVIHADGTVDELGLMSLRVVTTAGVNYIVDAFANTTELENLKYHGYGTGATAEAAADTALVTELTTQYATDNTRPTGTTTEGASANIYRTVATLSPDASVAITEHGVFSATTAGTLLDRSLFSAVNLTSADSLQTTYDLTLTAGS